MSPPLTWFESGSSSSRSVAMCSELIAPIPRQTIPFLVFTVVAQYSASPSTSQGGHAQGRGCRPIFERIWWAPSCATVWGFKSVASLGSIRSRSDF